MSLNTKKLNQNNQTSLTYLLMDVCRYLYLFRALAGQTGSKEWHRFAAGVAKRLSFSALCTLGLKRKRREEKRKKKYQHKELGLCFSTNMHTPFILTV